MPSACVSRVGARTKRRRPAKPDFRTIPARRISRLIHMMKNIEQSLTELITQALGELGVADMAGDPAQYLEVPSSDAFGDYSSTLPLRLSRQLKKPPRQIAAQFSETLTRLLSDALKPYVAAIKPEGAGFVNFYLSNLYLYEQLQEILRKKEAYARDDIGKHKKVLIEFVSANPTGALSVAHARQAAVGDCLASILTFLGFDVFKEYYLNDEGNQINILGNSIALRLKELSGEKIDFPEDHYQGEYIYDIAREIKEKGIVVENYGDYGAACILEVIKKELEDFGVTFDNWYSQKALGKSGKIEEALEELKKKGLVYESEGAWWLRSTEFGDDKDRVVVKSDGSYTYLAPDIAYHQEKYRRGFQWLINLWGPDHHGYINRLKASVAAFGGDPDTLSVIIVQLATIFRGGKPVQMSTRKGQYITLREVLNEVGLDASRFFFLMRRTSSHLDFDLDIAKKQTSENPVYYVQYAHARMHGILRSSPLPPETRVAGLSVLTEIEEINLMRKLTRLPRMLRVCLLTQDPYMLTVYLQEVASEFHKFYDRHRVLGQDEGLTRARLALLEATRIIVATGLRLLGVSRPEKM